MKLTKCESDRQLRRVQCFYEVTGDALRQIGREGLMRLLLTDIGREAARQQIQAVERLLRGGYDRDKLEQLISAWQTGRLQGGFGGQG
jgi:Trp operon repressor